MCPYVTKQLFGLNILKEIEVWKKFRVSASNSLFIFWYYNYNSNYDYRTFNLNYVDEASLAQF
jgi:hypothetical protein